MLSFGFHCSYSFGIVVYNSVLAMCPCPDFFLHFKSVERLQKILIGG